MIAFDRSSHRTGFISEIFLGRHSSITRLHFCNYTGTSIVLLQIYSLLRLSRLPQLSFAALPKDMEITKKNRVSLKYPIESSLNRTLQLY